MAIDLYFEEEDELFYLNHVSELCMEMGVEVTSSAKVQHAKYKVKFRAPLDVLKEFLPKYITRVGTVPVDAECDVQTLVLKYSQFLNII